MAFNPDIHHRRSLRLKGYDYSSVGAYFVTICTWQRECLFGTIEDGKMRLNAMGLIVESLWCRLPEHFTNVALDTYIVMPNHFHGILQITAPVGAKHGSSASPGLSGLPGDHGTVPGSFCAVIQNFKSVSTRKVNKSRSSPGCPVWQRNYYERVIRNEKELIANRQYIMNNPMKWGMDKNNPNNM